MRAAPPPAKARPGCWQPAWRLRRRSCSCASSASWLRSSRPRWRRWGSPSPGWPGRKPIAMNIAVSGFATRSIFCRSWDFAVFLGAIIVLGRALGEAFGATGAVTGAIVVGLVDVDAVTVSMVRLTPDTLSRAQAVLAILAAVASDTVSKIAIGAAIGRGWFAADLAVLASGCLAVGGAAAWLTFAFLAP